MVLQEWFEKPEQKVLCIADIKGQLIAMTAFPQELKSKGVYFMRTPDHGPITADNVAALLRGDLSYSPVDQLSSLVDGFFVPLLSNKANVGTFPHAVQDDVTHNAQSLKSTSVVLAGCMKGTTPLPMPAAAEALATSKGDSGGVRQRENDNPPEPALSDAQLRATVHAIESSVISWTRHVRSVLMMDNGQPLIDGGHPFPLVELNFWKTKLTTLQSVHSQLLSPTVRTMHDLLRREQSSYASSLDKLIEQVEVAVLEADDISAHLEPLRSFAEEMEEVEFELLTTKFAQTMAIVALVWCHSRHYSTARQVVILLREVLNVVIHGIIGHIEPRTLFGLEVEESVEKPRKALQACQEILKTFEETRAKINKAAKAVDATFSPWEFETGLVFGRLQQYIDRLQKIGQVLDTAFDYAKLEKVEISGAKLNGQVKSLFKAAAALIEKFGPKTNDEGYNCLDPGVPNFVADYDDYMDNICSFDRHLATIIRQAFREDGTLEGYFKIITGAQGLLERPEVKV